MPLLTEMHEKYVDRRGRERRTRIWPAPYHRKRRTDKKWAKRHGKRGKWPVERCPSHVGCVVCERAQEQWKKLVAATRRLTAEVLS